MIEKRFTVHKHDADRAGLHYDLRLEINPHTVLSFALRKGIPMKPGEKHLAIRTENHPHSILDFEGTIPTGKYGAGNLIIDDAGTYKTDKIDLKHATKIRLIGEKYKGKYIILHLDGNKYLIYKIKQP